MRLAALLFLLLAHIQFAEAANKIDWGSRVGMTVTIIQSSGLDTANAVIRTKHTREDAISYCGGYVGKVTRQCFEGQLGIRLKDTLRGNCITGEFTDFQGARQRYLGVSRERKEGFQAKHEFQEVASGEIADGSNASGYPALLSIFRALCPRRAPPLGDEYWR